MLQFTLAPTSEPFVSCFLCGEKHELSQSTTSIADHAITTCHLCGGREFFIRKDFPQRLGMAIVVVFGVVASILFYRRSIVACYATLAAAVLIDALIYLFVGRVTVCYRCRAEYRRVAYNPGHGPFDLATSEKYPTGTRS
jgi:hypothetical protein